MRQAGALGAQGGLVNMSTSAQGKEGHMAIAPAANGAFCSACCISMAPCPELPSSSQHQCAAV